MSLTPDKATIAEAIDSLLAQKAAERDFTQINAWVEQGIFSKWTDDRGRNLMHFAAAWGNADLAEKLMTQGVSVSEPDHDGRTPIDIARGFAQDELAKKMEGLQRTQARGMKNTPVDYNSLEEIRNEIQKTGKNIFYDLAAKGEFNRVVTLALADPQGLTADDLLSKNNYGDTVLLALCRQGSFSTLLQKPLWQGRSGAFETIWSHVPYDYKKNLKGGDLLRLIKQESLISRTTTVRVQRLKK